MLLDRPDGRAILRNFIDALHAAIRIAASDVSGATWAAIQFMSPHSGIVLSADKTSPLGLYTLLTSELEDGDWLTSSGGQTRASVVAVVYMLPSPVSCGGPHLP